MTRLGIISDTHHHWDDRFYTYFSDCQLILHAGDIGSIEIIQKLQKIAPVRAVYGNIDPPEIRHAFSENILLEIEKIRIFMTHIGGYPGKYQQKAKKILEDLAQQGTPAKLFICGHSHILKVMYDENLALLHINPGAAGLHGWHAVQTLIKLDLCKGKMSNLQAINLSPRQ